MQNGILPAHVLSKARDTKTYQVSGILSWLNMTGSVGVDLLERPELQFAPRSHLLCLIANGYKSISDLSMLPSVKDDK